MRGGGALCAESEAWGELEKRFGRIYVPHTADEEILGTLSTKAKDPDLGFLLVLIGMPGTGKSLLLRELIDGLSPTHFSPKCKAMIDGIINTFEFRDVAEILPFDERKRNRDYPSKKRIIWVTTALDDFVDTSVEVEETLQALVSQLNVGMGRGESLIVFGNRGILGDVIDKNDRVIRPLSLIVAQRNKRYEFVRIPRERNVFWIKQFGVEEPLFHLTNGVEGLRQYSKTLINLSYNYLRICSQNMGGNCKCQACSAATFLRYISELKEMLENTDFIVRVHDLLLFLWLRHRDLYLTPRSLNLFWGYFLYNLWKLVEEDHYGDDVVDKSLIYDAVYLSRLPSIRGPEEYCLTEAKIHKYRDEEFERDIISRYDISILNKEKRRRERLKLFFSPENIRYRNMIDNGALDEFLDLERLSSKMDQVLLKLALMRPVSMRRKLSDKSSLASDPLKLLFGPLTELVEKPTKTGQKARRLPVIMFDNKLVRDITYHGFRVVPDKVRYFEMRERILELDAQISGDSPETLPCFYIDLQDYEVLRDFISEINQPDLSLSPSLIREVLAFVRRLNGMVDYLVAPLMHGYLKDRSRRTDEAGLFVHSIRHEKDCDVKIGHGQMLVSVTGETYKIDLGE